MKTRQWVWILAIGFVAAVGAAATLRAQPDPATERLCGVGDEAPLAFQKLVPVLRDPRCSNCHGGIDPFKPDGGHGGGFIDPMQELQPYGDPAALEAALQASPGGTDEHGIGLAKERVTETLNASTPTIGRDLVEERLRSAQDLESPGEWEALEAVAASAGRTGGAGLDAEARLVAIVARLGTPLRVVRSSRRQRGATDNESAVERCPPSSPRDNLAGAISYPRTPKAA